MKKKKLIKDEDFLKTIFEQNWLHARHIENERMWFTNIFALVIATTLSFLATREINDSRITIILIIFLILFAFIGCFAITKLNIEYHDFKEHALFVVEVCHLKGFMAEPLGGKMGKLEQIFFTFTNLFLLFYTISAGLLCALLAILYSKSISCSTILALIIFIILFIILRWYQNKKMNEINAQINGSKSERLLATGDRRGFYYLDEAMKFAGKPSSPDSLLLELSFYRYAHIDDDESREKSREKIIALLDKDIRCRDCEFSNTVKSVKWTHPDFDYLIKLSDVISDKRDKKELDDYKSDKNNAKNKNANH